MFARFLLCIFGLIFLISCGADKDIVTEVEGLPKITEISDTSGADAVSSDHLTGDIPVVTLSADGLWDEGGRLMIQYSLEIDRPLAHNLSIYLEYVSFDVEGHIRSNGRSLSGILQGETESLELFFGGGLSNKLMLTILPASKQKEVTLPRDAFVGFKGDFEEKIYFPVPEGYQFKPYRVGTPSQIVHKREDIVKEEED